MNVTKNDLSYNKAELDYQALLKTSEIAFAHTRNELDEYLHQTHDIKPRLSYAHLARIIKKEADELVIAAETMHTLQEGLEREEIIIVNKEG